MYFRIVVELPVGVICKIWDANPQTFFLAIRQRPLPRGGIMDFFFDWDSIDHQMHRMPRPQGSLPFVRSEQQQRCSEGLC